MKKTTLKWGMIRMLTIGWFLPLLVIIVFVMVTVTGKVNSQVKHTVVTSADKAVEICDMRIEDAITASKNASYMPTIKNSYAAYQQNGNQRQLYENITLYLEEQYKYNSSFKCTMVYFTSEPNSIYYTYRDREDATYSSIQAFRVRAKEAVQKKAKEIDTATAFVKVGNSVYMVRNIVNAKFQPMAVIVMELDTEEIFESLESIWNYENSEVYIDGNLVFGDSGEQTFYSYTDDAVSDITSYKVTRKGASLVRQTKACRNTVTYGVNLDAVALLEEINSVKFIFIAELLLLVPMVFMILRFFQRRVNRPIHELTVSAKEIEAGNYGYRIEGKNKDQEFYYLDEAFNQMSKQLKLQFEKIYLEEIALRDANIMALQSQINPHFLNNTLEIINWEARMTGNQKVSGMIEALSTMLEATMNRSGQKLITLEEELNYVDAYLFIIGQRFGEKFEFRKEMEDELLTTMVPRLIIQPIMENAVEHGMNMAQKGWIHLRIFAAGDKVYIEVKDNGKLMEEEEEKIRMLLSEEFEAKKEKSMSLGIRNVNRRLKIIYGNDCGLYFSRSEHDHTISTIVLKRYTETDAQ